MSIFRTLHLSDIHIGDTYKKNSADIAYRLITELEKEELINVNNVIVSGDIFEGRFNYDEKLINEAVSFFNIIFEEIKKETKIEKDDFLFVPGNHDMIRSDNDDEIWKKYKVFLSRFYGTIPDFYNLNDFSLFKVYESHKIAFVGFNSCCLEMQKTIDESIINKITESSDDCYSKNNIRKSDLINFLSETNQDQYVDYGEISQGQILNNTRLIRNYDDYNIVAFFHHHFYLFPEINKIDGDSSLIRNFTDVIYNIQQMGIKTVIHGHKHLDLERPLVNETYYENAENIINVFAGGSLGSNRVPAHSFNVFDFFDKNSDLQLIQRKIGYTGERRNPTIVNRIPPDSSANGQTIKLIELLKDADPDLYEEYTNEIEKINIAIDDYNNLNKWLDRVFVGFSETCKVLKNDPKNVFILLVSMNYRVLKMKQAYGHETIDDSYFSFLEKLIKKINFEIIADEFLSLFADTDLRGVKEKCDCIMQKATNKATKRYLAFSMTSVFITDLYLILRYYADEFYNKYITYKVNIRLDENEFHQNVPVERILIKSDADRRSAYIDLKCTSATAHKLAVLFIKEFELILNKYEDFFKIIGLKLYYILPKIEKGETQEKIDNYNFEAYIPTLIPLLTGDNIYSKKEVFARELIQNSIDAIAVRESKGDDFDKRIYITLGNDKDGRSYFKIQDHGTGMDRFKIERYFTSIGRSFYSGDEYQELNISYKPISNFGIGFLSTFMVCREIDVKTRYYEDDAEGLKLHIPNYDGCFFIEKDDNIDIGTEITLYIDKRISHNISFIDIIDYIKSIMKDINYEIIIDDKQNNHTEIIKPYSIREEKNNILFVPFLENYQIKTGVKIKDDVWTGENINQYKYGMIVNLQPSNDKSYLGKVFNSGILLNDVTSDEIWEFLFQDRIRNYDGWENFFTFNLPSNYISIDVSREKITELSKRLSNNDLVLNLLSEILSQVKQYIHYAKINQSLNVNMPRFNEFIRCVCLLCEKKRLKRYFSDFSSIMYNIDVAISNDDKLNLSVSHSNEKEKSSKDVLRIVLDFFKGKGKLEEDDLTKLYFPIRDYDYMIHQHSMLLHEFEHLYPSSYRFERYYSEIHNYMKRIPNINNKMAYLVIMMLLVNDSEKKHLLDDDNDVLSKRLLEIFFQDFTVSDIESGNCSITLTVEEFNVFFEAFKKTYKHK